MPKAQPIAGVGAAQMLNESIVTTTTANGGLETKLVAGDLKSGVTVVIKATNQTRVHLKRDIKMLQEGLNSAKRAELSSLKDCNKVGASFNNS